METLDERTNKLWTHAAEVRTKIDMCPVLGDLIFDDLELEAGSRLKNTLINEYGKGVTVGYLRSESDENLMRIPNFGRKSLKELRALIGPSEHLTLLEQRVLNWQQIMGDLHQIALDLADEAKHNTESIFERAYVDKVSKLLFWAHETLEKAKFT